MIENEEIQELLSSISARAPREIYNAVGSYFIIKDGELLAIPDTTDAGNGFDVFRAPSAEEKEHVRSVLKQARVQRKMFSEILGLYGVENTDELIDYYESEDNTAAVKAIRRIEGTGEDPYDILFKSALLDTEDEEYGYCYDGHWIPLYENIEDTGEEYHITDMIDDDELIEILQNIEDYAL